MVLNLIRPPLNIIYSDLFKCLFIHNIIPMCGYISAVHRFTIYWLVRQTKDASRFVWIEYWWLRRAVQIQSRVCARGRGAGRSLRPLSQSASQSPPHLSFHPPYLFLTLLKWFFFFFKWKFDQSFTLYISTLIIRAKIIYISIFGLFWKRL